MDAYFNLNVYKHAQEIRNPLTAIIGFADILIMDNCLSIQQESYIRQIKDQAFFLLEIIERLEKITEICHIGVEVSNKYES